jgi:hypothetical protein
MSHSQRPAPARPSTTIAAATGRRPRPAGPHHRRGFDGASFAPRWRNRIWPAKARKSARVSSPTRCAAIRDVPPRGRSARSLCRERCINIRARRQRVGRQPGLLSSSQRRGDPFITARRPDAVIVGNLFVTAATRCGSEPGDLYAATQQPGQAYDPQN